MFAADDVIRSNDVDLRGAAQSHAADSYLEDFMSREEDVEYSMRFPYSSQAPQELCIMCYLSETMSILSKHVPAPGVSPSMPLPAQLI